MATATAEPALEATAAVAEPRQASLWRDTLGSIVHQRSAVVGLAILLFFALVAIFAAQISPYDPNKVLFDEVGANPRIPPCIHFLGCPAAQPEHWFGLDGNGRDLFSRV